MQGRVTTWGSSVPPEIPLGTVQITGTEPGSTYAGHFFLDESESPLLSFKISSSTMPVTGRDIARMT